jgi:L-amino acid N-acyltransferase YncA
MSSAASTAVAERLGQLHGRWRDVLLLERRSPAIS